MRDRLAPGGGRYHFFQQVFQPRSAGKNALRFLVRFAIEHRVREQPLQPPILSSSARDRFASDTSSPLYFAFQA